MPATLTRAEKRELRKISRIEKRTTNSPAKMTTKSHGLNLKTVKPLTYNQKITMQEFDQGKNLLLHGLAGTGKTFLALYLALKEIQDYDACNEVMIIRSIVPGRDIGFLPGTAKEKAKQYEMPYQKIFTDLYGRGDAYEIMKQKNLVSFETTSFMRGNTLDNTIVILDEMQNCNYQELSTIISRLGKNSRIILAGDAVYQSDLQWARERQGIIDFMEIIRSMDSYFSCVEFDVDDIVRSGIVKSFIMAKINFEKNKVVEDVPFQSKRDYKVYS